MKRWQYFVLIGVALAGLWVYLHRQDLGLVPAHTEDGTTQQSSGLIPTTPFSHPVSVNWVPVDRSLDGFRLEMPADFKELHVPAYTERGTAEMVPMLQSSPGEETTYSISWSDNPPVARTSESAPERILDMARDNAMLKTQTTLVTESRTSIGSFPARDFIARNSGGGILQARLLYTGQRLYMLAVAFPSDRTRSEKDVAHFYNSFAFAESSRVPEVLPGAAAPAIRRK